MPCHCQCIIVGHRPQFCLLCLASCLIYAKPFRHPFRGNPAPISVLVWVRCFIEPDVLKTRVPFDNTAQIYLINLHWKLGLGFKLRLGVALF